MTKVCSSCRELKALSDFNHSNYVKSGKSARCRNCENIITRKKQKDRKFSRRVDGVKECTGCFEEKLVSEFNSCPTHSDGLTSKCRECANSIRYDRVTEGVKKCYDCGEIKSVDTFYSKKKSKDGLTSKCKDCIDKDGKKFREKTIKNRNGYIQNTGTRICTRCEIEKDINKFSTNPNGKSGRQAWCRKCTYAYQLKKKDIDLQYKLSCVLRNRILRALDGKYKNGSAVRDLGCSIEYFVNIYIPSKFYSSPETGEIMTWENHGKYGWHIDHIKPLSSFDLTDRKQFLEACHYTNLQPLWARENLSKGAKLINKASTEVAA